MLCTKNKELKEQNKSTQTDSVYSLSVIVPVYNRRSYLPKTINMLKAQTLDNIKFIIIDDGSSDGSFDYLQEQSKDDKRFSILKNKKNKGVSAVRNMAIKFANSQYIGFFDADDEIPSDYFEKLYQKATSCNADIVFTNYNDEKHCLTGVSSEKDKYKILKNGAIWDKIYKTSLIKENDIEFAEGLYTADNLFNIMAFHSAQKIELVEEPRYIYELHTDSIGKDEKLVAKRKKDILKICRKIIQYAQDNKFDTPALLSLQNFLRHSYNCYLDDSDFRYKLYMTLQSMAIKIKSLRAVAKHTSAEYDAVADSGFFDAAYYRLHNPSLWFSKQNLLEHYLTTGWLNGINPSKMFDGNKYLYMYPDVAKAGVNPLIHFITHGKQEKRIAFPVKTLFSKKFYKSEFTPRLENEYNLLKDSEYFSSKYYRLHNPKLLFSSRKKLLKHYLIFGWFNGQNPSAEFDGNKYLAFYPDIAQSGVNPLVHYLRKGQSEGRQDFQVDNIFKDTLSKTRYYLEYPIRVKEEYDRLTAEIRALEKDLIK